MREPQWFHILPFMLLSSDFKVNWEKSMKSASKIDPNVQYLPFLPLLLLYKAKLNVYEHLIITLSYSVFVKEMKKIFDTQKNPKREYRLVITTLVLLMILNYSLINRNYTNILLTYAFLILCSLGLILTKQVSPSEAINDIIISHASFAFSK